MTSGDGMMVMITSSAQKHTQNSSAAGGNTYRGIRSASTSGTGVTTTQGIAMVSGYGFGNSGVRQQPAGIGVVRRGLSGTGDPSGGRDDNGIWSEWLDEYVEYWLGLSENAGKTEDDVTGDYLQTWWEDNYGDDFMPDLGWTDWAQQWFLSPVGDAWGVLALFIVGYVLCLKLRIAKRKGEEK